MKYHLIRILFGRTYVWSLDFYWPIVRTRPYGFQVLADTALRIHPARYTYGLLVLGFGFGLSRTSEPWPDKPTKWFDAPYAYMIDLRGSTTGGSA